MAPTLCKSWLTIVCKKLKSLKFCVVQIIYFYSNCTIMWTKYLPNNVWSELRFPMSASATVKCMKYPIKTSVFALNVPSKLSRVTVMMLPLEILSIFIQSLKYLYHMLVKFTHNCTWNFELFDKKLMFLKPFLKKSCRQFERCFCSCLMPNY